MSWKIWVLPKMWGCNDGESGQNHLKVGDEWGDRRRYGGRMRRRNKMRGRQMSLLTGGERKGRGK